MATEDILINDGDSFVSLTALTAAQVDAKLPIESDDGTVKLDSTSANTFAISTGGEERVKVSEPETVIASRYVKQSPTAGKFSQHQWTAIDDAVLSTITQYNADYDAATTLDVGPLGLAIASPGNVGLSFAADKSFIVGSNVPRLTVDVNKIRCEVPVLTSSVSGIAANDAQMLFRTAATLYADYSTPLTIESGKDTSFVNYKNGSADSFFTGIGTTKEFEISTAASTADDARFRLSTDCILTKGDGTAWEPKTPNSIATKKTVDDKIWVGSTAQYNAIPTKNPTTLYCLTD